MVTYLLRVHSLHIHNNVAFLNTKTFGESIIYGIIIATFKLNLKQDQQPNWSYIIKSISKTSMTINHSL